MNYLPDENDFALALRERAAPMRTADGLAVHVRTTSSSAEPVTGANPDLALGMSCKPEVLDDSLATHFRGRCST